MACSTVRAWLLVILLAPACGNRAGREVGATAKCDGPSVAINVAYPGASASEVEQNIVLGVEEAAARVAGVAELRSTARPGLATLVVAGRRGTDGYQLASELMAAIQAVSSLPEAAEVPTLSVVAPADIVLLVLSGDEVAELLGDLAESLRQQLLAMPGIADVELLGAADREVSVELDANRLVAFGLTLPAVADAIGAGSIDLPGGAVQRDPLLIRVAPVVADSIQELGDVVIARSAEAPIRLGEVATIREGLVADGPRATYAGRPAVVLAVRGHDRPDRLAETVRDFAATATQHLPEGMRVAVLGAIELEPCRRGPRPPASHPLLARVLLPPNTSTATLRGIHDRVVAAASGKDLVVLSLVGASLTGDAATTSTLDLLTLAADAGAARALGHRWRSDLAQTPGLAGLVVRSPDLAALTIELRHADLEVLARAAAELATTLAARTDLLSVAAPAPADELIVTPADQARQLGLEPVGLARQIRAAVTGIEAARFSRGRTQVAVMVRMSAASPADPEELARSPIMTPDGRSVPLSEVATIERRPGPAVITRVDRQRVLEIELTVDPDQHSPRRVAEALAERELPALERSHPGLVAKVSR